MAKVSSEARAIRFNSLQKSSVLVAGFGLVLFATLYPIGVYSGIVTGLGVMLVILSVSVDMFVYLQDSRRRYMRDRAFLERRTIASDYSDRLDKLSAELKTIKLAKEGGEVLSDEEREQIKAGLLSRLESETLQTVSQGLLEKLRSSIAPDQYISSIRNIGKSMQERLEEEVTALGSRANINLIIGIGISLVGLTALGYFVLTIPAEILSPGKQLELIGFFSMRLSLVVFIEVFAYFFLRLYRYSLFEIKYFQNEMTNADFKMMALEAALMGADKDNIKKICADMSKTERNFILKKGETTLALKGEELEQASDRTITGIVERVLDQREKGKSKRDEVHPKPAAVA
jgi:hypothetical protein